MTERPEVYNEAEWYNGNTANAEEIMSAQLDYIAQLLEELVEQSRSAELRASLI